MVFKRYSNPFSLMDSLIDNNMFSDFIPTIISNRDDELLWDVWVNTIIYHQKTFDEYKKEIQLSNDAQRGYMNEDDIKTTINKSKEILSNFTPQ